MNKNLILPLLLLFLTSCSGSKKVKNLVDFTPRLVAESSRSVQLGSEKIVGDFGNQLNFAQNMGMSVKLTPFTKSNFKKIKLTNGKIAALPSIVNGNIYIVDSKANLESIDLKTGKKNWLIPLSIDKGSISSALLTYQNEKLYVIADLQLFEINAVSGKEIIKKSLNDLVRNQPLIRSNGFFIQNVSNNLTAYNIENWAPAWRYETWPETISTSTITSPVAVGNQIITNYSTGQIISNDIADGKELWQLNLYKESDSALGYMPQNATCQPIVVGKDLFVASNNGYLIKVDVTTAGVVWQKPIEDIISMSISGNSIFVTNNARQLAAISIDDGSIIWVSNLLDPKHTLKDKVVPTTFLPPIVSNLGVIVLAKDKASFIFDPLTGALVKYFATPKNISSFGISEEELVVFDDANAYILN